MRPPSSFRDGAIEAHVAYANALPTWKSTMHIYPVDGAAARVAQDATAWAYAMAGVHNQRLGRQATGLR